MRTNALSALGRLGYGPSALIYPGILGYYVFVSMPKGKKEELEGNREVLALQTQDKPVDPDLFNPFSAIPFHNNPEMKYIYADVKMRNYINRDQINVEDYFYKAYHNSYDHGNKKTHLYNWVSVGIPHH